MMMHFSKFSQKKIVNSDILTLDIEVSSFWMDDSGIPKAYDKMLPDEYYNAHDAGALCYIWMFSINDTVYYGRDLEELPNFLKLVNKNNYAFTPIIWVHNFSYEFHFLLNYMKFENVFAREERHPMKAEWDGYEFRCSYTLTRLSLEKWGETLDIQKKVGQLDYNVLRTPRTELTEKEKEYCEYDCLVVYKGIQTYVRKYGSQDKIPLTQTGEVRKDLKDTKKTDIGYLQRCTKCLPRDVNEYKELRKMFGGGDTHANILHVGHIVKNVGSFDETSAYPAMLVRKKYPSSPWMECALSDLKNMNVDKYAYMLALELTSVQCKGLHHPIAASRMVAVTGGKKENGRIISAEKIVCLITDLDYYVFAKFYDFDAKILYAKKSIKRYLDGDLVNLVLDFFYKKTAMKGVDEDLYLNSKQKLNSFFGMMVTDLCQPYVTYANGTWTNSGLDDKKVAEKLKSLKKNFYKNFLSYSWGVYITAYNRAELWNMIAQIYEKDVVYYDTDSVKILRPERYVDLIKKENARIAEETERALEYHDIKKDAYIATAPNGKKSYLGFWENEAKEGYIYYDFFITQGAKKYAYIKHGKKGIEITVAGVPKKAAKCLNKLTDFKDGFIFDREICAKNQVRYIDDMPTVTFPDGYISNAKSGIAIKSVGYRLGKTLEFKTIIAELKKKGWNFK